MGSSLGIEEIISGASRFCLRCSARTLFEMEPQTRSPGGGTTTSAQNGFGNPAPLAVPAPNPFPNLFVGLGNPALAPAAAAVHDQNPPQNPNLPTQNNNNLNNTALASVISQRNRTTNLERTPKSSTEILLKQITAWDYHRLQTLHRQRTREIKEILQSSIKDLPSVPSYTSYGNEKCGCTEATKSKGGISAIFIEAASKEIDDSGPTSEKIFSNKFLNGAIAMCCADCTKRLLVIKYDNLMGIKSKIDALTDHL